MSVPGSEADPSGGEEDTEEETPAEGETGPGDEPAAEPEKLTRKERRAALEAARDEAKRLETSLGEERTKREALEASVAEMRGYLTAQAQQAQNARQQDDGGVAAQVKQLEEEAQRHLYNAQASKSPEVAKAEFAEFQRKGRLAAKLETRSEIMGEINRDRANMPTREAMTQGAQISVEYPWLGNNRAATAAAAALEAEMIEQGKPASLVTSRAAASEIAKRFGLGGHANGTGNKGAFSGVPSREGATGSGGQGPTLNATVLEKWQRDLAEKAFPKLEAPLAHKAWTSAMNKHFKANPNG